MTKHRSPDERSEQILEAARKCFLRKGYFDTKMDEIARESGLSKGGIYFHFDSKREIFRCLVQEEYDSGMAFIDSVTATDGHVTNMLVELGTHFVELFASDADQPRFMVIIGEMGLRDEEIREMLLELQQNYIRRIGEILDKGVKQGQIRAVDGEATAIILKAMLDGLQATFAMGYRPDIQRLLPAAVDVLINGLAPPT